ncbi:unnamed protein product [Paramecium primaurelia]|uniref:Uncharacterized protein n=1 Tax=Paramecium primaurelia TaxID=5886 RepID=A0A8S1QML9_PARPR|nr:unnamed protein product [Paramecium primaurelia]
MKLNFYLGFLQFCFVFSQPTWSTIYSLLPGLNGTDSWFKNHLYGGPISSCSGYDSFGGRRVFGIKQVFIKIECWNGESFQLIYDNDAEIDKFGSENDCNGESDENQVQPFIFTLQSHFSQSLVLIMTTNVNTEYVYILQFQKPWGIREFKIEIQECPEGCLFCQDYISDCKLWNHIASYWQNSINSEGWLIDNNQLLTSSFCAGIQIAGGTNILQQGQSIKKVIQNVPNHFKIQIVLKLWVMGITQSQNLNLKIGEQGWYTKIDAQYTLAIECVNSQQVNIYNIALNIDHSSPEIEFKMFIENNKPQIQFWGVSSFDLYVAQCSIGCEECNEGLETQCSNCLKKWGLKDGKCIPAPPLEYTNIRIYQSQGLKINFINSFQLYIQELDQTITTIGQNKLIIDKSIIFSSFLISVKCQDKMKIESFFRNCNQCDNDQISFSNYCLNESNIVNFSVIFADTVQSEKELIINISQTKVEILQVILQNGIETEVQIMKIEL